MQNAQAKRELKSIWASFKRDPVAPLAHYWHKYVITGMGLFIEGYVLFSIGEYSKTLPLLRLLDPSDFMA